MVVAGIDNWAAYAVPRKCAPLRTPRISLLSRRYVSASSIISVGPHAR